MTPETPPSPEQELVQLRQEVAELREEKKQWIEEREQLIKKAEDRERDAIMDELTKVLNRRGLNEMAPALLPREGAPERDPAKDRGRQVVAMFDLDNFKKLNTDHGHLKADEVLKNAAQALKGWIRGSDIVARYGGEEFVIVFTNASGENIKARLYDEEKGGWKMSFTTIIDGEAIQSSFSGGITEVTETETIKDFSAILERANQAMRQSKESGKNRVTQFEERTSETNLPSNGNETQK